MTEKKKEEIVELIFLSEKILKSKIITDEEREKQMALTSMLVEEILLDGGYELFFEIEERVLEKLKKL